MQSELIDADRKNSNEAQRLPDWIANKYQNPTPVPEIIDPVFATENERFGLVFANTGSINSGTVGAEFLDVIGTKVLRVFLLLFTVTSTNESYSPPPLSKRFETGL